jgi:hypothetical protein
MKKAPICVARASAALATLLVASMTLSAIPAGASRAPRLKVKEYVDASTYVKAENQTTVMPTGVFTGVINENNGKLTGNLSVPPATSPVKLEGQGVGSATIQMVLTKPVSGRINFKKFTIRSTSTFNIDVTSLTPTGTSLNLVGNGCRTATPITLTLTGAFAAIGSSTYTGTFTIPPFTNCLAMTPLLTQEVSGPGNTITATFSPS